MKNPKLSLSKMIPNMITLTGIALGMTAVKFAIVGKWEESVIAIVAAAFMDAFDGATARLLKAQSKLGAELDSLADFVCFGVSPALVVFLWSTHDLGRIGWATSLIFAMAGALRLARFNISKEEARPDDPLAKYFTGVPAPMGGGLALLPMILSFQLEAKADAAILHYLTDPRFVGVWLLVLGAMMVSHIPTFSSKQIRVSQKMAVPALAIFGILIAGLINVTWPTLTLFAVCYLLALPFSVRHYNKKKRALAEGVKDPDDLDQDD